MTDSSYDDDDSQHDQHQSHHHQQSHSAFTQRFKQFPSAFKKAVSRDRVTNTDDTDFHHHEKSSSSFSIFKNRFPSKFHIRSSSDTNLNNSSSNNNGTSSASPGQYPRRSTVSLSRSKKQRNAADNNIHYESPTPPSLNLNDSTSNSRAFEVIINENRALKNEIEVYKRSIDALSVEKDDLVRDYDELKSKVTDVTTQLRIMTRRYNKIKNKNEEYKKHFQNTLTTRLSAQQDTIRNYHNQLTQIKEKYDILYNEYLDKNNIIKDWEAKYRRLQLDFDEFASNNHGNGAGHNHNGNASMLVKQCKDLKHKCHEREESLRYLAQIINQMYQNSLPIISNHYDEDEEEEDEVDEDEDEGTSSEEEQVHHRGHLGRMQPMENANYLSVQQSTPPNSSYAEDEEDEDEEVEDEEDEGTDSETDDDEKDEDELDDEESADTVSVDEMVETMQMHPVIYHDAANTTQIPSIGRGININGKESAMKEVESLLPNILGGANRGNKGHRDRGNMRDRNHKSKQMEHGKVVGKKQRKKNKKKRHNEKNMKFTNYRHDSHMNDADASDQNQGDEELMDSENENDKNHQHQRHLHRQHQAQQKVHNNPSKNISIYANKNKLTAPINKLNNRSLSDISIDDDGIDKRDDDELEHQLQMNPIKLPPKINIKNATRSRPSYRKLQTSPTAASVSTISTGKSSPPPPSVASSSGCAVTKKKRRRSWVMEGGNGPILITTIGGKHQVVAAKGNGDKGNVVKAKANNHNNNSGGGKAKKSNDVGKTSGVKGSVSGASSSSSSSSSGVNQQQTANTVNTTGRSGNSSSDNSMDVAPSPAPPPPHPYILQTPNTSPHRNNNNNNNIHNTSNTGQSHSHSQSDDNRSNSPIISNNISDQLSTPSPNPMHHGLGSNKKKINSMRNRPEYSQRDDDDDHDDDDDDESHVDHDGNESY